MNKDSIADDFNKRIRFGLYGGREQYYIVGVDGTLAQLGNRRPPDDQLRRIIDHADREHEKLMAAFSKTEIRPC